jgi:hypothetical protein
VIFFDISVCFRRNLCAGRPAERLPPRPDGREFKGPIGLIGRKGLPGSRPSPGTRLCGLPAEDLLLRPNGRGGMVWVVAFKAFAAYWAFNFSAVRPDEPSSAVRPHLLQDRLLARVRAKTFDKNKGRNSSPPFKFPTVQPSEGAKSSISPPLPLPDAEVPFLRIGRVPCRGRLQPSPTAVGPICASAGAVPSPSTSYFSSPPSGSGRRKGGRRRRRGGRSRTLHAATK